MSTYTAIADAEIDVDSPVTQILLTKYRENMLAIQQGDASAPRIQVPAIDSAQLTAAIIVAIAGIAPGGVGYTSLLIEKGTDRTSRGLGDTLSGSNLTPISFRSGASSAVNDSIVLLDAAGSTASGTWKLGADYAFSASNNDNPIATWTRIS